MQIINGTYGANIHETKYGEFDVTFLYNIGTELHQTATGDVWERKTFKSQKTAERKVQKYFEMQGA